MSETTPGQLAAALCKAQSEMEGAKKDSENPFFKSKYADLASVWDACRGPLTSNGLAVTQATDMLEGVLVLVTTLHHVSGETVSGRYPIRTKDDTPQALGSAMTYARRYSLAAMVGVCPEDDDGEAAQARDSLPAKAARKAPSKAQDAPRATQGDQGALSVEQDIRWHADEISRLRGGVGYKTIIREASGFPGKDRTTGEPTGQMVYFEDPSDRKATPKWKNGTLTNLKKILHEETLKAEPGAAEAAALMTGGEGRPEDDTEWLK